MLRVTLNFSAAVVDEQSYLDGARALTIEGESQPSLGWRLGLTFRWLVREESVAEGDLTLVDPTGAELYASLAEGSAAEITDAEGEANAATLELRFDVSGGDGGFADATGSVHLSGTLAGQGAGSGGSFEGEAEQGALLTVTIDVDGEGQVWRPPPEADIPTTPSRTTRSPSGGRP